MTLVFAKKVFFDYLVLVSGESSCIKIDDKDDKEVAGSFQWVFMNLLWNIIQFKTVK